MNSGMWITFLPSSGCADRPLAAGRDDPPFALCGGGG
jgi:hypothetical protein